MAGNIMKNKEKNEPIFYTQRQVLNIITIVIITYSIVIRIFDKYLF